MGNALKHNPHDYQLDAIAWAHDINYAMLILDMGLGKTSVMLHVLKTELNNAEVYRPLIIAPKLVTEQTWLAEIEKWSDFQGLSLSRIIGTEKQRIKALNTRADIYAVSRDSLVWLKEYLGPKWRFDRLVVDESSSFKNPSSNRTKALLSISGYAKKITLLSGTPAPNGLLDLWPQIKILDGGQRLEKTQKAYRSRYFYPIMADGYAKTWVLHKYSKERIYEQISDIAMSMRAKDYLDLKPRVDIVESVTLPEMAQYKKFQKDRVMELPEGDITASNIAGLYNKLLQFCNGAVYDEEGRYHVVSDTKLEVLQENIEAINGNPVIVFYQFRSDVERILKTVKNAKLIKGSADIYDWNAGKTEVLLAHAASMGHGLNLQDGGRHMLWYGLPWSLEQYLQAIARLDRQGQTGSVINKAILTKGTVEELVYKRLNEKDYNQQDLIKALRKTVIFE